MGTPALLPSRLGAYLMDSAPGSPGVVGGPPQAGLRSEGFRTMA